MFTVNPVITYVRRHLGSPLAHPARLKRPEPGRSLAGANRAGVHYYSGNTGPLRLDRLLRKEKYNDSHTLKRLLEDHREAECFEPRDKVYGLVGLALGAAKFPLDYKKSLYEVWKDTMVFMNDWDLFKDESQILVVAALVKSLLIMANHNDPLSQISNQQADQVDATKLLDEPNSPLVFHLAAIPVGCILCVGPSVSDLVADPDVASAWRLAIQKVFSAAEWGPARQESDELLRALLESNDSDVEKMCFNRPSSVVWKDRGDLNSNAPLSAVAYIKALKQARGWGGGSHAHLNKPQTEQHPFSPGYTWLRSFKVTLGGR